MVMSGERAEKDAGRASSAQMLPQKTRQFAHTRASQDTQGTKRPHPHVHQQWVHSLKAGRQTRHAGPTARDGNPAPAAVSAAEHSVTHRRAHESRSLNHGSQLLIICGLQEWLPALGCAPPRRSQPASLPALMEPATTPDGQINMGRCRGWHKQSSMCLAIPVAACRPEHRMAETWARHGVVPSWCSQRQRVRKLWWSQEVLQGPRVCKASPGSSTRGRRRVG